ncbi:precorrin-3B C(17)-methyltransferase [Paludicola sp. MB14-C6]|uniref:precorrin-3B C(17)-methyltransferase n=1 Tax=Paludihabitans sp. MB14-C6 TaxID=3070656 RepID=UPI0027DB5AF7|nr:precorrin-3B C(17)-methyltransferase [Paludicola sp. MB14-C6]WMJ22035.1 precorrin-3B C(17)-methyltransferase [Paludicola sp. MB14-C6]
MKKIYVVGIGPGNEIFMTNEAKTAIQDSDVIVGYDLYVELIKELVSGKTVESTPMKKEVDRCKIALEYALKGQTVSMVCSGDAGVYGMAGIMIEVAQENPEVEIQVVSGITAACSSAAVLGAPLIHDFAIVSLSDLLTPWEKIEKRLRLASDADFVICLYNPSSKKRHDYLKKACEQMLLFKSPDTKCGYVKNIGREGQSYTLCTLQELKDKEVDMFTTVIVGNSQTKVVNGKLVTPRGYHL